MPFRFNMQKVLDYREQLEDEAKIRLARAESNLKAAEENQQALISIFQKERDENAGKLMDSGERWLYDQYMNALRKDIEEAAMQTRMARQVVEEARKLLAMRAIDKKMLDKLKERKKDQFNRAEQKQEQYFNDEIATIRYKAPVI